MSAVLSVTEPSVTRAFMVSSEPGQHKRRAQPASRESRLAARRGRARRPRGLPVEAPRSVDRVAGGVELPRRVRAVLAIDRQAAGLLLERLHSRCGFRAELAIGLQAGPHDLVQAELELPHDAAGAAVLEDRAARGRSVADGGSRRPDPCGRRRPRPRPAGVVGTAIPDDARGPAGAAPAPVRGVALDREDDAALDAGDDRDVVDRRDPAGPRPVEEDDVPTADAGGAGMPLAAIAEALRVPDRVRVVPPEAHGVVVPRMESPVGDALVAPGRPG